MQQKMDAIVLYLLVTELCHLCIIWQNSCLQCIINEIFWPTWYSFIRGSNEKNSFIVLNGIL